MFTQFHADRSNFLGRDPFEVFFKTFKMEENLYKWKLWVLEANVFLMRRGISVQSFMSL